MQGVGRRDIDGTFNGVAPALSAPGEVVTAGAGHGRVVLPAGVVNELLDQQPTVVSATTAVDLLEFTSPNTTPALLNMAAGGPVVGSDVLVQRDQPVETPNPPTTIVSVTIVGAAASPAVTLALPAGVAEVKVQGVGVGVGGTDKTATFTVK